MEAYREPIERLLAAMERFVRDRSLRLLHVVVAPELRAAALDTVLAFEWHAHNRSPFVAFEQGHTAARPAWDERADDTRGQHARRRAKLAEHGGELPALPAASGTGQAAFASVLLQLLHATPPHAEGLNVVLAPASLADAPQWLEALRPLVADPRLQPARFVIVEPEPGPSLPLATELGEAATSVRVVPDAAAKQRELDAQLAAFPAATPPGAGPAAAPPPHPARPPPIEPGPEAKLRAVVVERVVAGSLAVRDGRVAEGVQRIREARDMCEQAGMHREAINLELVLGGQLAAAGAPGQAEQSYARAIESASKRERHDQAATARFALGAVKLGRRDRHGAMVTLAEGTVAAERSGLPALAIEGGRLTGQVAAELGMEAQAIAFFTKAVKLAEAAGPQAPLTSAGESARRLAAICAKRGLREQAATFDAKAEQLEHLVVPEAPTVLPETDTGEAVVEEAPPIAVAAQQPVVSAPVIFGAGSTDDDEGTDLIAIEELAAMHWGGGIAAPDEPPPALVDEPAEVSRGLSAAEIESLRVATFEVLDEDSTGMLTADELAALRGEAPMLMPPPEPVVPAPAHDAEPSLGFDLSKIAALREQEIEDEHEGGTRFHRRIRED
jgi:tetratricopeptide (TPR) repeat protein